MPAKISESLTGNIDLKFPEYLTPPDEPIGLLRKWLDQAQTVGVREPRALSFATVDQLNRPSSRIVVVSGVTEHGVRFASHTCSKKAKDIETNPYCSGLLYWRETSQQIILNGAVQLMSIEEADLSWTDRPIQTYPMSIVARQSAELLDVEELRTRANKLAAKNAALPRPDSYRVFELCVESVEFWGNGEGRLHERLRFDRDGEAWIARRLQP